GRREPALYSTRYRSTRYCGIALADDPALCSTWGQGNNAERAVRDAELEGAYREFATGPSPAAREVQGLPGRVN
ncbi:MAG: hypothetical protein L0H75_11140, partial [Nitrosospira sp.]|nr:hypothetical protein [Nitrosospira sp.]